MIGRSTPVRVTLLALGAWLAVTLVSRIGFGIVSPVEVVFEGVTRFLGVPWVFNLIHAAPWDFDRYVKFIAFGVIVLAWLIVMWWVTRRLWIWRSAWGTFATLAAVVVIPLLLLGLGVLPLMGLGVFGTATLNRAWPPVPLFSASVAALLAWSSLVLMWPDRAARTDVSRRAWFNVMSRTVLGLALGASALSRAFIARAQALQGALFDAVRGISPAITPLGGHYVVSKNFVSPRVREGQWRLEIAGLVDTPLTLDLDALRALPSVTRPTTLMCVSNQVGGDLIGTYEWTGVRLADLLELTGIRHGASEIVLYGADNYTDSFPLDVGLRDGTIVAYLHNGEPLTRDHGFPARVLVPGIYGMKNVKWVERIELAEDDHIGYWQARGWSDEAIIKTLSRIDMDQATRISEGRWAIGGVAFAGIRGIRSVEISIDGGDSWQDAVLEDARGPYAWSRWTAVLDEPTLLQGVIVMVRATDGTGDVQTEIVAPPLPDGASGYHRRLVTPSA